MTTPSSGLRLLLGYARQQREALAAGALLTMAAGLASVLQPLLAKEFVETLGSADSVARLLGLLGLLVVGGAVLSAAGIYVVGRAAEGIVLSARRDLIGRILRLKVGEVDRLQPGDLLSRVTADTTLLRAASTDSLIDLGTGGILLVGMVALMGYLDPVLLAVLAGVIIAIGLATSLVLPRIGTATKQSQDALGEMAASLDRVLGAIRTVKANGAELREAAAAERGMREAWRQGLNATLWRSIAGISSGLAIQVSFLAILAVGGARVASGALPVSALIAFLLYLFYLTGPIAQLVTGATGLQAGLAAARRISEISALEVEPAEAATGEAAAASSVSFQDVVFRYHEDAPTVLAGVTVEIPRGGLTAIVGSSGAGKSTLFGILERFYDVESGVARVAGRDVRDWQLPDLRAHIGYVEQDAPVLAGTLRDNLLLGAPGAAEDDLVEVIARTRLGDLVDRLPEGLDTSIGHRGTTLSGGERQRIAIARALLRRPGLLLLDEATSQLDAVNEAALRDVIADVAGNTTVIAVAHRLSTVTTARQILLLDSGRIRCAGTHEELLRTDTLYRTLAATQFLDGSVLVEESEAAPAMEVAAP